jgi:hypothetical protein
MSSELDKFFACHDWAVIEATTGWKVTRDEQDAERVLLDLVARDGERYLVLFLCDGYPKLAPSVAFVSVEGSKADPKAWPHGDNVFLEEIKPPSSCFICMPLTREGLRHHPDWATSQVGAWNPSVHTLIDLFNRMQRLLSSDHYLGRGGK